jgi:hypothetical protein
VQNFQKKTEEVKDYVFDWTRRLGADPIVASTWEATPATGITIDDPEDEFTGTSTTVWVATGTPGQTYTIENTVTTTAGRVETSFITVYIKEVSS